MARRPRLFAPGLLYHVIVRGNQRRKTFLSGADYQAYLERLGRYRGKFGHTIHAYCLMPNHVHLLVESSSEPLAKFMQGLQQSYSQYYNLRHRKTGHVFQGRYKAIVCEKDEYLLQLIRHIHLNPVRADLVRRPIEYPWSSYGIYLGAAGNRLDLVAPGRIVSLFGPTRCQQINSYQRFVEEMMAKEGVVGTWLRRLERQKLIPPRCWLTPKSVRHFAPSKSV